MNYPIQWGPQTVFIVIAVISVGFIIWAIRHPKTQEAVEVWKDKEGRKHRSPRLLSSFRWGLVSGGVAVLVLALLVAWIIGAIQVYLQLTSRIQVAHVRATPVKNSGNKPMMSVELTLYDDKGNKVSDNTYIVNGDEVFIGGDIVAFPGWMNIVGIHSGYKLTKLEGMYSDVNLERTEQHTVEVLNGGDDYIFNEAYHKGWPSWIGATAYKNGSSVPPNGIGYNICVSQDAIVPQPDSQSC